LALGAGDGNYQGSFDVTQINNKYLGFNAFSKTGAGAWELTNTNNSVTPWTIYDGALRISSDAALGATSSALTFGAAGVSTGETTSAGSGQLQLLASVNSGREIKLQGNAVISVGNNSFTSTGKISGDGELVLAASTGGSFYFTNNRMRQSGGLILSGGDLYFGNGASFGVNGDYEQGNEGKLHIALTAIELLPTIMANKATLNGTLDVSNYKMPTAKVTKSSALADGDRILIQTEEGIEGNFTNIIDQAVDGYDYLRVVGMVRNNDYVMGLNLAWNSDVSPSGNFTLNNNDFAVEEVLANRSDGGDLRKAGIYTLSLSAENTYTGRTIVDAGRLALTGNGDISRSSEVSLNNNSSLDVRSVSGSATLVKDLNGSNGTQVLLGSTQLTVENANNTIFSGSINGTGSLNKTGKGDFALSGAAGSTSGKLLLSEGSLSFVGGATYQLEDTYTQHDNTRLKIHLDESEAATIIADRAELDGSLMVDNYKITKPVARASELEKNDRVLIATSNGIGGDFTNAPDQAVEGYDYLRQSGQIKGNNYVMGLSLAWNSLTNPTGSFTLNAGDFDVDQALGNRADGGNDLSKNGTGTLYLSASNTYSGSTDVNAGTLALTGEGDISESSRIRIRDGASLDLAGVGDLVTTISNLTGDAGSKVKLGDTVLTVDSSIDTDFSGQILGRGGLTKSGDNTLTLSGNNEYTGATVINGGVLLAGATDIIATSSGLEVRAGATFRMNDLAQSVAQISSTANTGTIDLGNTTLTLTGNGASTASYAGEIIGSGNLVKNGGYTQYLRGDQAFAYSGTTTINAGVLALREMSGVTANKSIFLHGGWLDLSDNSEMTDWSGLVIADAAADGTGGVIGYGDVIYLGDGNFNASIGAGDGGLAASNGVYVIKETAGETILGGAANTYVGNTRINAGMLTVSRDDLLGNTTYSREVVLNGGSLRIDGSFASDRALQLAADANLDVTFGNTTEWKGGVAGLEGASTSGLLKTGAGTLILSGSNHYIGGTSIAQGKLVLKERADLNGTDLLFTDAAENGEFDVSGLNGGLARIGTLTDNGSNNLISLGANTLQVSGGGNFAGSIQDTALSGDIGGSLLKSGDNTLTLSGINTYTGTTKVSGGILSAGASDIIASSSGLELEEGAIFRMNDLAQSIARVDSSSKAASIDMGSGTLTLTGNGSSIASYNGSITGTGELVKNGSYTQYLHGDQALGYSGITTINEGVLALRDVSNPTSSRSIVLNGGWLDLSDNPALQDWTNLVITDSAKDGTGGVIGHGDAIRLENGEFNVAIGASEDMPAAKKGVYVVKETEGETILGGADNSYVGNTRINAGILTVSRDGLLGDTENSREVILGGGTLRVNGSFTTARAIELTAEGRVDVTEGYTTQWGGGVSGRNGDIADFGLTKTGSGTLILSGANDYAGSTEIVEGTLALGGDADLGRSVLAFAESAENARFDISTSEREFVLIAGLTDNGIDSRISLGKNKLHVAGGGTFNGNIQDGGLSSGSSGGLVKSGSEDLILTAVNDYTGTTRIIDGGLILSGAGSIANSTGVLLDSGTAALDISATDEGTRINNLSGVSGSQLRLGDQTLTINQTEEAIFVGNVSGNGGLQKTGDETLTLAGELTYSGDTVIKAGKLVLNGQFGAANLTGNVIGESGTTLSLLNGATLTGTIDPLHVEVGAFSTWNMTGNSSVETMTLDGTVRLNAPEALMSVGRTLTANNWVGEGGTVTLNTVLGADDSVTDQIIIDGGTATGETKLNVINAGGLGAQTTGDGIKVVSAINDATTEESAFALSSKLFAGAFEYKLERGGVADADDWYLVSIARAESALYNALGSQTTGYGQAVVGSLVERMGAPEQLVNQNGLTGWGRVFGQADYRGASKQSVAQNIDVRGMQVGHDIYVNSQGAGRDSIGLYVASGQSTARIAAVDTSSDTGSLAGTNVIKAYSAGAYLTRLDGKGAFLDAVLQATRYNINSQSSNDLKTSTNAWGLLGSVEVGQAIDLSSSLKLESQAQISVQHIKMRDLEIDEATTVRTNTGTSVTSRAGLRLSKTGLSAGDHPGTVWLGMDVLNTSGSNAKTTFATPGAEDVDYVDQLTGSRLKLSAGSDGEIAKNLNLNLRVSAEKSIDSSRQKSFGISMSLKFAF
ncbi:outer membrane autotransporter protein, partial [Herbaspirillum sp. Sphag1AN]|uniref:autotransporter-associated beta strand repeat-containing protein n=1 Tax=unclassified Herbaspirillum TaxID=2624150 RepID=UPI0016090708